MEVGGYCGSVDDGGAQIHVGPILPTTAPMVTGREDVEHGPGGKGGAVPVGLNPMDGLLSL